MNTTCHLIQAVRQLLTDSQSVSSAVQSRRGMIKPSVICENWTGRKDVLTLNFKCSGYSICVRFMWRNILHFQNGFYRRLIWKLWDMALLFTRLTPLSQRLRTVGNLRVARPSIQNSSEVVSTRTFFSRIFSKPMADRDSSHPWLTSNFDLAFEDLIYHPVFI